MNIFAINGSPRKTKNTATILQYALDGAVAGALEKGISPHAVHPELIHLYDYAYTGCKSCFACKRLHSPTYGQCAIQDELQPLLQKLATATILIFGSPIYFMDITGQMHSFLERLLFPYLVYDQIHSSLAPQKPATACIYTMNATKDQMTAMNYEQVLSRMELFIGLAFTPPRTLAVYDTYQFDDYSHYKVDIFSESHKRYVRENQFPLGCQKAFDLGKSLC